MTTSVLNLPVFSGVSERLKRAHRHLKLLDSDLRAFGKEHPNPLAFEQHSDHIMCVARLSPIPPAIPLLLGEAAHQLRAALDNTVFLLMKAKIKVDSRIAELEHTTQFPICDTPSHFAKNQRQIKHISTAGQAVVQNLQPYNGGDIELIAHPLRILRELSDRDKHRLITPCHAVMATATLSVTTGTPAHPVFTNSPLEDGAYAGKIYFLTPPQGHVKVRLKGGASIALYEGWSVLGGIPAVMDAVYAATEQAVNQLGRTI